LHDDKKVKMSEQTTENDYRGEEILESNEKLPMATGEETLQSGLRLNLGLKREGGWGAVRE
jgi:hypothetical protein